MVDGKVGVEGWVGEVAVKGAEYRRHHHALVDDRARRERAEVRLRTSHTLAALVEHFGLSRATHLVKRSLESVAAERRVVQEGLPDSRECRPC